MAIILLMDQTELDTMNDYFDAVLTGWSIESFRTPLELMPYYPTKIYCTHKHNIDNIIHKWAVDGILNPNFEPFIDSLETQEYNSPLWKHLNNFIPTNEQLILAPIGAWSFLLNGPSAPVGVFMQQVTGIASNITPSILPANLHVVSMTWINATDDANEDINIYLNDTLLYTWQLRNTRWGVLNAPDYVHPILTLPERGLLKAEIINVALPVAQDGILTMYFRLVGDATPGEFYNTVL